MYCVILLISQLILDWHVYVHCLGTVVIIIKLLLKAHNVCTSLFMDVIIKIQKFICWHHWLIMLFLLCTCTNPFHTWNNLLHYVCPCANCTCIPEKWLIFTVTVCRIQPHSCKCGLNCTLKAQCTESGFKWQWHSVTRVCSIRTSTITIECANSQGSHASSKKTMIESTKHTKTVPKNYLPVFRKTGP